VATKPRDELNRYGLVAMRDWFEKKDLTHGQALVVGLWLAQAGAVAWLKLPLFVWRRGKMKTKEWYDD
jgi:hypothetical protein